MAASLTAAFATETALISYRAVKRDKRPPLPSELGAAVVLYGLLGVLGSSAPDLAGVAGWAFVLATLLNLFPEGVANTQTGSATSPAGSTVEAGHTTPPPSPARSTVEAGKG